LTSPAPRQSERPSQRSNSDHVSRHFPLWEKAQFRDLQLNLKSDDVIIPVRKTVLFEKPRFFHDDPSRLNAVEYREKSKVPSDVFRDFVSLIEGKPIQVAEHIFPFLRSLSDELGFEALFVECNLLKKSHMSTCEYCQLIDDSNLESRIAELEERQLLVERSSGSSVSEIEQLLQTTAFLESDVSRLSFSARRGF
jgi:hypothetical protein